MKCSFLAITICLASLATINTVRVQENTSAAASEKDLVVLTPPKGGTVNKIYDENH